MTQPPPGPYYNSAPPQRGMSKGKKIGFGCGGCLGILVIFGIVAAILSAAGITSSSSTSTTSSTSSSASSDSGSASTQSESSEPSTSSPKSTSAKKPSPSNTAASKMIEKYGTFKPITRNGTSAAVVDLPSGAKGALITATYRGSSNFIVSGLDDSNQSTADIGLPNAIGNYEGTSMVGQSDMGNPATRLKVEASGPWAITIKPVSSAPSFPAAGAKGKGDTVYIYTGDAATLDVTAKGSSNFIVSQVGEVQGASVNEIGNYAGQTPLVGGPQPLVIQADGSSWSLTPSK